MELQNSNFLPTEYPLKIARTERCKSRKNPIAQSETAKKACSISAFSIIDYSYLQHHRIGDQVIYPAAGYSMAGVSIYQLLHSKQNSIGPLALQNIKFRKALQLEQNQIATLQLGYESKKGEFTVHSRGTPSSGQTEKHAVGQIIESNFSPNPNNRMLYELQQKFKEQRHVDKFYNALQKSGLNYGTFFKRISSIRLNKSQDQALSRLDLHPELTKTKDRWAQRITLLDSAFQSLAATLHVTDRNLYIPSRIQNLRILDDFESDLWCHARLVKSTSRSVVGDITLFDEAGKTCVEISGLHCLKATFEQRT